MLCMLSMFCMLCMVCILCILCMLCMLCMVWYVMYGMACYVWYGMVWHGMAYVCMMYACTDAPHIFFWVSRRDLQVRQSSWMFFQSATQALCWRWHCHSVSEICHTAPTGHFKRWTNFGFFENHIPPKQETWLVVASRSPRFPSLSESSQIFSQVSISQRSATYATRTHQSNPPEWPSWRRTGTLNESVDWFRTKHGQPEWIRENQPKKIKKACTAIEFKFSL